MENKQFSRAFLILLVVFISALFLTMIRSFLMTLLLAGITAGLVARPYRGLVKLFRGKRGIASGVTLLLLVLVILVPLLGLLGIVANEALGISERVQPWVSEQLAEPDRLLERLQGVPGIEKLEPYRAQMLEKAGAAVGAVGNFLFDSLSATTRGTLNFLFYFFLFLYSVFFFLLDGGPLLQKILYYTPLDNDEEQRMVDRFVSVTRATLKGTLLIGVAQGSLAGLALWIAGVDGAFFWGTLMVALSVVPGIGTALVWLPAAIILFAMGKVWQPIFLILFCGLVVGSIDNLLRPRLVGRDTSLHDLLILLSTLGGIFFFGVLGFIVGPIVAALFVTVWEIYGHAFRDFLPAVPGMKKPGPPGGR